MKRTTGAKGGGGRRKHKWLPPVETKRRTQWPLCSRPRCGAPVRFHLENGTGLCRAHFRQHQAWEKWTPLDLPSTPIS